MWGSCLDHVLEVEVVTADGKIQRASERQNPDLFFVRSRPARFPMEGL
jgi:FAD/FMN-containing dehydrogenase